MNTKKSNNEFAKEVASLVRALRGKELRELLTAVAYVHKDVTLYKFLEAADEAHDDARRVTQYVALKELGYDEEPV